jgi:hypothetical protein
VHDPVKRFTGLCHATPYLVSMARYNSSDDGKVVGGRSVVWMGSVAREEPQAAAILGAKAATVVRLQASVRNAALQRSQAAALQAAAEKNVPFCEECEMVRKLRAGKAA